PFARNVERRAVIDRRADDRQTQGDVHSLAEGHQLDGNQSLIVITGHHHVELATARADEDSIAWIWARHVYTAVAAQPNGRRDHRLLFAPEQAVFAGVRVQAGNCDARRGDAEARKLARGERD